MKRAAALFLFMLPWLWGCATVATPTDSAVIQVYASSATQPWLVEMYDCARQYHTLLVVADPATADVALRLGEPADLSAPAFQVDRDDFLVVTHPQTGVGTLTLEQVRAIISGQVTNWSEVGGNNVPIQVWVYSKGEDVQQAVEQAMQGLPIASSAHVATSAQAMSDSVGSNPGSVGFLPRRRKAGNTHETLTVTTLPVLAITPSEPQGALKNVLACLQK